MYFQICNFGFRSTALSGFADEVLLNMEKGNICGSVFLDLSTAFDTIDHGILMSNRHQLESPHDLWSGFLRI